MTKPILPIIRFDAYRLLLLQLGIVLITAIFFLSFQGLSEAGSSLLGGLICVAPNYWFAKKLLAKMMANQAKQMLKTLLFGETVKLTMMSLLFVLAIKFVPIALLPFLAGFIAAQFTFWLAPLVLNRTAAGAKA